MALPTNFQETNRKNQNKSLENHSLYTFIYEYKKGQNFNECPDDIPTTIKIPARPVEEAQEKFIHNMDKLMDEEYIFSYTLKMVNSEKSTDIITQDYNIFIIR